MAYAADDRRGQRKLQIAHELLPGCPTLPHGDYQIIVTDPPWRFDLRETDASHRGRTPYPNMDNDKILAMDVGAIAAKNAYLFLWTTVQHQQFAYDCLEQWGFTFKSIHYWIKVVKNADLESEEPKIRYGTGHYGRNCVEPILIGVKGKMPSFTQLKICDMANAFYAPIGRHSEKPPVFWQRIERVVQALDSPPRIELFARDPRPGWDIWGAEAPTENNNQETTTRR